MPDLIINDASVVSPANFNNVSNKVTTLETTGISRNPVLNHVLDTPPVSPALNDRYIIPAAPAVPTGAWAANAGQIAQWNGTAWIFTVPTLGFEIVSLNGNYTVLWNGTTWQRDGSDLSKSSIANLPVIAPVSTHMQVLYNALGEPVGKATIPSITNGGSIPAAEYGEVVVPAWQYTGPSNTWQIVPNSTIAIPSAGIWEINGQIRAGNQQQNGDVVFALFDSATNTIVASSEIQPVYISGLNNVTDTIQGTGSLIDQLTTIGAQNFHLRMKVFNHMPSSASVLSDANGRTKIAFKKVSAFVPVETAVLAEVGQVNLSANYPVIGFGAFENVPGFAFTLTNPGTYRISIFARCSVSDNADDTTIRLVEGSTEVPNSLFGVTNISGLNNGTDTIQVNASNMFYVTITNPVTYNVQMKRNSGTGPFALLSSTDGQSKILYEKVSGNTPVSMTGAEFFERILDSGTGVNSNTASLTYVDVPNSSFSLPSGGEWEINVNGLMSHNTLNSIADIILATSDGTELDTYGAVCVNTTTPQQEFVLRAYQNISSARNYKLMYRARTAGTATILNNNTLSSTSRPRISARKISGLTAIPTTLNVEADIVSLQSNQATGSTVNNFVDFPAFPAPSSGVFRLTYNANAQHAIVGAILETVLIVNGIELNNSRRRSHVSAANGPVSVSGGDNAFVSQGQPIAMRLYTRTGGSVATLLGTPANNSTTISWEKIAGYVGSTAQVVYPVTPVNSTSGGVATKNTINRINTLLYTASNLGFLLSPPADAVDGDWFTVLDETGSMGVIQRHVTVKFTASQPYKPLVAAGVNDVLINWNDACVQFLRIGGSWRIISQA
jgi:hypothetical protein